MNVDLIKKLKSQGTWRLFFLVLVSLSVYYGHYIKRQSRWINELISNEDEKISSTLVIGILVLGYLGAASSIASFFYKEGPLLIILGAIHYIWITCLCVWSLVAGKRMNMLNSAEEGSEVWFHGFWGMFFTPLYFNYKVNKLNEMLTEPSAS
ncbi:MAG: hypothetical protein H8E32_17000 [Nitrospinae bacterium]|nr:hypothetical protein [Nitrospinota bacterium]